MFAISLGEFNASFLLNTPINQTYPAALYDTYNLDSFQVSTAPPAGWQGRFSLVLFGWVLDVTGGGWEAAFASRGLVALTGPAALLMLRSHPASRLMAGGRR